MYFKLDSELDPSKRNGLLARLTSSIDKGRWLLPNDEHVTFGKSKESAYTGFRQAPLDDLMEAYKLLLGHEHNRGDSVAERTMEIKRRFASAIQEKLEPRSVERDLAEMRGEKKELPAE